MKTVLLHSCLVIGLLAGALATPALADEGQWASTLVGAGLGGWAGSSIGHGGGRVVATTAGVFAGGAIGHELGRSSPTPVGYSYDMFTTSSYPQYYYPYDMFSRQVDVIYQPTYVAPPEPAPPPPITYVDEDSGQYCREYSQQTRIGNHVQESYGTACLESDGAWHIVQ